MGHDPFQTPDGDIFKKMLGGNPGPIRGGRGSWTLLICALLAITFACAGAAGGQTRKADLQTLSASKARADVEAAAVRICESLARDPDFLSDPDRKMFLLPALAAVRPLSRTGEAVFRTANAEGYFNSTGPLLVANGSPRALALFEEMIADSSTRAVDRVDMLHKSVLAHRTRGPVLAACLRLLARGLEPEVEAGLVETLFDYQEKRWFGVARSAPVPPPWNTAETAVLQSYLDAAKGLRRPGRLPDNLQDAIEGTTLVIRNILATRAP